MSNSCLRRDNGFAGAGDDFYAALMQAHEGLSDADSVALNARLVLLLANQVGDLNVVRAALLAARESLSSTPGCH